MRVSRCLPLVLLLPLSQPPHSGNPTTDHNGSHNTVADDRTQDSTASPTVSPVPSYTSPAAVTGFPGVLTYHNNNLRTGLNAHETTLTPANVNSSQFGKLFTYNLDGDVHAQVLYIANITIGGVAHNVVFVATEHDSVYAFDADGKQSTPLWQVSCMVLHGTACSSTGPTAAVSTVSCKDVAPPGFTCPNPFEVGIVSTPVIDATSQTLYVVAKTREDSASKLSNCVTNPNPPPAFYCYYFQLHALNLATGTEKPGSPAVISFAGSTSLPRFNPLRENNRAALLLSGGKLYIAFGSRFDVHPYHGWLFAYRTSTFQRAATPFNSTPVAMSLTCSNLASATDAGGIWSVGAVAADSLGSLFVSTGQGVFDNAKNFGDTFLRLDPNSLLLVDHFTPFNQADLNCEDWDAGSGGPLLLPDAAGSTTHPHLMIAGTKEGEGNPAYHPLGRLYLIDRDTMGGYDTSSDNILQELQDFGTVFNTPAYWNGFVYVGPSPSDMLGQSPAPVSLKAFSISKATLSSSSVFQTDSNNLYSYPGANPSVSANGTTNGIVWTLQRKPPSQPSLLHAYNATSLKELYNSSMKAADAIKNVTVFTLPTVASGKVYLTAHYSVASGTVPLGTLYIFGLLP
jgi:hypothetical protein